MLDRAENLLHDHYGGREYWDVSTLPRPLCMYSRCESFTVNSHGTALHVPWKLRATSTGLVPLHSKLSAFTVGPTVGLTVNPCLSVLCSIV